MKRILTLCPTTFGYEKRTREAFERLGHDVVGLDERIGNDFLSKAITRLGLIRYMPWLLRRHVEGVINTIWERNIELVILLDPETITGKELSQIRAACPNVEIVIYTWDCFARKPISQLAFEIAEAVYSFDIVDCEMHCDLHHMPLFHNFREVPPSEEAEKVYDFSFIGTARFRRIKVLAQIAKMLKAEGRPYFFHIKTQSRYHDALFRLYARLVGYEDTLTLAAVPYEQFIDIVRQSRCIVDIEFSDQTGLTMRTFEVVFSGVPLLTTNANVCRYDFIEVGGIFIFDDKNPTLPPNTALKLTDVTAYFQKYSIDNWADALVNKRIETYMNS